jgi:hypothetical protein
MNILQRFSNSFFDGFGELFLKFEREKNVNMINKMGLFLKALCKAL